jgi:RNA polymerase sigma factor (sigma-70 family)
MVALTVFNATVTLGHENADHLNLDLDLILHGIRAGSSFTPALFALMLLIQTGRLNEAAYWSERLLAEPWIRRVPMRGALFELIGSAATLHDGALLRAQAGAQTALDLISPAAWGIVVGIPLSLAVHAATELGDFQSAMSYLNVPVPAAMFDTPFALPYLQALGRYHLAKGHRLTALRHFQAGGDLMARWRVDAPELTDWRDDTAAVTAALGQKEPQNSEAAEQDDAERGVIDARAAELTDAERRVAALAAAGVTNREIASQLFITVSTVEQHLTKIYRKLNVRRRSGLPDGLIGDLP